jgi:hypothetical protein
MFCIEKKGTVVTHLEHSPKTSRIETGVFAALRACLGLPGRGTPAIDPEAKATPPLARDRGVSDGALSRSASSLRRRPLASGSIVVLAVAAALGLFAAPALAERLDLSLEVAHVHATRAEIASQSGVPEGQVGKVECRLEYATSKEGPWTVASSDTTTVVVKVAERSDVACDIELRHLAPGTTYYLLATSRDQTGEGDQTGEEVKREAEFTTSPVAVPELECVSLLGGCTGGSPLPGAYEATFQARIESNAAETEYNVEYATSPSGGSWTPIASGTITVAQSFEELTKTLTGLEPETTYYIRVTAKNEKGKVEETVHFTTEPPYPNEISEPLVSDPGGSSVHLDDGLDPRSAETHWRFEYITAKALEEGGSWIDGPEGTVTAAEATENESEFKVELSGLDPGTLYDVRLFAENGHPPSQTSRVASFETAGAPLAETFATHTFQGEAIRLLGSVEPHGYDTHYRFQYVTQAHFEHEGFADPGETPELDAGAGGEPTASGSAFPVSILGADLPVLAPGETYRYRIVTSNLAPGEHEAVGGVRSLTVPVAGGGEGAEVLQPSPCLNEAFRTGPSARLPDCRAYEQVTPTNKEGAKDVYKYGAKLEGTVLGADGDHVMVSATGVQWGPSPDPVHSTYVFSRQGSGWQMTSARPVGEAEGISYGEPALWSADLTNLAFDHVGWNTDANISSDVELKVGPPGGPYQVLATIPRSELVPEAGEALVAASPDAGMYVISTTDRTLAGRSSATTSGSDLYEASDGVLRQLNVLGEDTTIGKCGAGMVRGPLAESEQVASSPYAISGDGSRVFFEAVPGADCSEPTNLYMRSGGTQTLDIGAYRFVSANPEGSELLLEGGSGEAREYLLYDTQTASARHLFSFSASDGLHPLVAEDLDAIYLQTAARLTAEAPQLSADAGPRALNVYRFEVSSGALSFLFQASPGEANGDQSGNQLSVSPEGRFYYFTSQEVAGVPGGATDQVYRYDDAAGVVQCVSCASPFDPEPKLQALYQGSDVRAGGWNLPASENGDYVFFDTPSALVPQDVDGEVNPASVEGGTGFGYSPSSDVYEWRRDGVDGCDHLQGCLALISSGSGGFRNELLGTDPSGRDVFFATHAQLVPSDTDTAGDVYDARIGGGFAPAPPRPVECEGDACSTPASPPTDVTPASLTFSGAGNILQPATSGPQTKPSKPKAKKKKKKKEEKKRRPPVKRRADRRRGSRSKAHKGGKR